MKVVVIDGEIPYPATSGKRLRTLNLMLPLAARHDVTYMVRVDCRDPATEVGRRFLSDHGIRVHCVHDPLPPKSGMEFYVRVAANLFSAKPYSVAAHQSDAMRRAVNRFADHHRVDLWQAEWSGYLAALRNQRRAPIVCMAPNVDTVIWERLAGVETNILKRWYVREQCRKFVRFERRAFRQADRVVTVSVEDRERAAELLGVPCVDVVENGVDFASFKRPGGTRQSKQCLFLGSLDWRPNQDAARWLLDEIVPRLKSEVPEARLLIVGRMPPAWLQRRVAETAGVTLRSDVADVRPYLAESQVMVVPLRVGGGSRLKILEALATGLPVVSTSIGAEGLRLKSGRHYRCADTADQIVAEIVDCMVHPEVARVMAQRGSRFVAAHYDWSMLADRLESIWSACVEEALVELRRDKITVSTEAIT